MIKYFAFAAAAALALTGTADAKDVPGLSGRYVYTASEFCPAGGNSIHQVSGSIKFDPVAGKAKMDVFVVTGNAPEILHIATSQTYSNDADFLNLGTNQYHITYGGVAGGNAVYASFVGLVSDGGTCGYQGTITLQ